MSRSFQLRVLFAKLPQLTNLGCSHRAEFLLPGVECGFRNAELTDDFGDWRTGFGLPQTVRDLFIGEAGFLHDDPRSRAEIRRKILLYIGFRKRFTVNSSSRSGARGLGVGGRPRQRRANVTIVIHFCRPNVNRLESWCETFDSHQLFNELPKHRATKIKGLESAYIFRNAIFMHRWRAEDPIRHPYARLVCLYFFWPRFTIDVKLRDGTVHTPVKLLLDRKISRREVNLFISINENCNASRRLPQR